MVPAESFRLLLAALPPLQQSILPEIVVNRGHQDSDGTAFAYFWAQPTHKLEAAAAFNIDSNDAPNNGNNNTNSNDIDSNHGGAQDGEDVDKNCSVNSDSKVSKRPRLHHADHATEHFQISSALSECSSLFSAPDLDAVYASEVADASTVADEGRDRESGKEMQTDGQHDDGMLVFSHVAMQPLNNICDCRGKAEDLLYSTHQVPCEDVFNDDLYFDTLEKNAWIDDPSLEGLARTILHAKMLVLDASNFMADRLQEAMDSVPLSDHTVEMLSLHEELYTSCPDYEV